MAERIGGWIGDNAFAILAMLVSFGTTLITITVIYTRIQDDMQTLKDDRKAQHEIAVSVDSRLNSITKDITNINTVLEIAKERAKWEADHTQAPAVAAGSSRPLRR